ncbi:hypothetical protein [Streptomyces sp. NPDC051546]|uniref:hypothetical protein n=1 Tax=Streptomyces sp. NPDC051546 TaxID=3365655 RepID=UPI0037AFDBAA
MKETTSSLDELPVELAPVIADGSAILDTVADYTRSFLRTPRPVRPRSTEQLRDILGGTLPQAGQAGHAELATLRRLIDAGGCVEVVPEV